MQKKFSVAGFLRSAMSYSVATYVNFIIYGLSVLMTTYLMSPEVFGPVDLFISAATLIMNSAVLGLDQAFIRFFNEPPFGMGAKRLFTVCLFFSATTLIIFGIPASLFFGDSITMIFFSQTMPGYITPLLFINAFLLMLARFYNIAYRMEQNLKLYTIESIGMQFFSRFFYVIGAFIQPTFEMVVIFLTGGLLVFALIFALLRRDKILPDKVSLNKEGLNTIVPYGLALAPTPVMLYLTSFFSKAYIGNMFGSAEQGIYSMVVLLSNVIAVIQAGFATYWSAFIYANYRTNQKEIAKVHDYVLLLTALFFALLIMFEDILFMVLGADYRSGMELFPILSLGPLFLIISETTVYGISISRRTIFDAVGIAISLIGTIIFSLILTPTFGMIGAAASVAISGILMFVFRTIVAQKFYRTIDSPARSSISLAIVVIMAIFGTIFTNIFWIKFTFTLFCAIILIVIYKNELLQARSFAASIFNKKSKGE